MTFKGLWRWVGVGALASAAVLGSGCGVFPQQGGYDPRAPRMNVFGGVLDTPQETQARQLTTDRGFNGTIKDLGSSIDPRTRETMGVPGRSLPQDLAWRAKGAGLKEGEAVGGSGTAMFQEQVRQGEQRPGQPSDFLERLGNVQRYGPRSGPARTSLGRRFPSPR